MKDQYELIDSFRQDYKKWIKAYFKDNIKQLKGINTETGLTHQQEHAFSELIKLINAKIKSHVGADLTDEEQEYANKIGISIMSGRGTGKDFFAALVNMYFQTVFANPKCLCTANTEKQLKNVLWSEFSKIFELSIETKDGKKILNELFEIQSQKIFLKEKKGLRWFIEGVTASPKDTVDKQAETLGGRHEDFTLFTIDEASGIPDAVFKPFEGTLTGICNVVLMIFNPTRSTGFAIRSQYEDSKRWINLRWNAEESELVSKQHIAIMEEKYGRNSNPFRIDVLGLPPLSDTDTLIPWDWIENAINRELIIEDDEPVVKGLDCGAGGDKSVIATRKGGKVYPFKRNHSKDSRALVDWAIIDFYEDEADVIAGDIIGIGWGVLGELKRRLPSYKVRNIDSRAKAVNQERYYNLRAELYWRMRKRFEEGSISIPDEKELIYQLSIIKSEDDDRGRRKIIKKKAIKDRIGHSPDEADALALTFAINDYAFKKKKFDKKKEIYKNDIKSYDYEYSWMKV